MKCPRCKTEQKVIIEGKIVTNLNVNVCVMCAFPLKRKIMLNDKQAKIMLKVAYLILETGLTKDEVIGVFNNGYELEGEIP